VFVEMVNRNLRLGRALIVIAGDGTRHDAEQLLADLHRYARFEFTLALVSSRSSVCRHPVSCWCARGRW